MKKSLPVLVSMVFALSAAAAPTPKRTTRKIANVEKADPSSYRIDAVDLTTLPMGEILQGFRARPVEVWLKEDDRLVLDASGAAIGCKVHFFYNQNARNAGAPVVLIHGYSDAGNGFVPMLREMEARGLSTENLVWLDWPRHGRANCQAATSFAMAMEATANALKKFLSEENMPAPHAIVGHSMGSVIAAAAQKKYFPDAKLFLLAPPIEKPDAMNALLDFAIASRTVEDAKAWIDRVSTGRPIPQVPGGHLVPGVQMVNDGLEQLAYDGMQRRLENARPLFMDLRRSPERVAALGQILAEAPLDKTTVIVGAQDRLTPWSEAMDTVKTKLAPVVVEIDCGHNLHRDCPAAVVRTIDQAGGFKAASAAGTR